MTTAIPPVKKVYCGDCQFYVPCKIKSMGHLAYVVPDECSHPRSFGDSYHKKSAIQISPSERNAENNCPDFKLKEE